MESIRTTPAPLINKIGRLFAKANLRNTFYQNIIISFKIIVLSVYSQWYQYILVKGNRVQNFKNDQFAYIKEIFFSICHWPYGMLAIKAPHNFLSSVALTNICLFTITSTSCSAIYLHKHMRGKILLPF